LALKRRWGDCADNFSFSFAHVTKSVRHLTVKIVTLPCCKHLFNFADGDFHLTTKYKACFLCDMRKRSTSITIQFIGFAQHQDLPIWMVHPYHPVRHQCTELKPCAYL